LPVSVDGKGGQKKIQLVPSRRSGARIFSAGLSLVQFRELLGNRRINELSIRFRVGSLTFCGGTLSSVPFVKKRVAELFVRFRSVRVEFLLRVKFGIKAQIHLKY